MISRLALAGAQVVSPFRQVLDGFQRLMHLTCYYEKYFHYTATFLKKLGSKNKEHLTNREAYLSAGITGGYLDLC